jgi:Tfp pilus assembly protein PilX
VIARLDRFRDEAGNVMVVALLVLSLLLAFGLALLKQVDSEAQEGGRQRVRESSFQVAEGALNAQIFQLSTRWPDSASPYPTSCTQGTTSQQDCPGTNAMDSTFTNVDQATGTTWTTEVRDNAAAEPNYWDESLRTGGHSYDANGDGFVWVRSTAVVRGRRRTVVALIKAETTPLSPPSSTVLSAGFFFTNNNGKKVIIDTNGASNQYTPGDVIVRCPFPDNNPPEQNCADYESGKGQVEPERVYSRPTQPNLTNAQGLEALRAAAKRDGNYYLTGCPSSVEGNVAGETVFIENGGNCGDYKDDYNTPTTPGVLVIARGTVGFGGNSNFYGLIYHANLTNSNSMLVTLGGTAAIFGSVVVDGPGGVLAGSSKENLIYNPNVWTNFQGLNAYGAASIVPNTFREIVATS